MTTLPQASIHPDDCFHLPRQPIEHSGNWYCNICGARLDPTMPDGLYHGLYGTLPFELLPGVTAGPTYDEIQARR